MRSAPELRVLLAFADGDDDDWWEILDAHVLVVEADADVVLTDGMGEPFDSEAPLPVVSLAAEAGDDVAGVVAPDAPVEAVVAALWAVHHGMIVRPRMEAVQRPSLTQREQEVLELLALGLSNREIGAALSISPHTAKFHVQGLLDKLDATTRTEAAVRAARMLLI